MVAAAMIGSAVVGGAVASDSSRRASNTQRDAVNQSNDLQREQFEQTRADNAGYRARGNSAGDRLAMLLGLSGGSGVGETTNPLYGTLTKPFTGADLASEPGYAFGLKQGNDAIERSASARGGLYSGATLKALQRYGQDYGGTKFNEAFNRDRITKDSLYNQLAGVAGTGQLATNQVSQAGQNFANNASANIIGAGNASAANQIARGNILTGTINNGLSMWQRSQPTPGGVGSAFDAYDPDGYGIGGGYGSGGDYSDARLKKNIVRIGTTERGNPVYRWLWKATGAPGIGVLAQEVAHIPGAVSADANGWLMVDYERV